MALAPYVFGDPFFGQVDRAMDRAMDRAFSGRGLDVGLGAFLPMLTGPSGAGGYPMDIVDTKAAYVVHADAPGFRPEDIRIEMNEGVLTISGKRKEERRENEEGKVVRRERTLVSFTRAFNLPDNVNPDGISAHLDKGVLKITVPKTEPTPKPEPKRIEVKHAEPCLEDVPAIGGQPSDQATATNEGT
eukprot:GHRR01002158.1.p1 GENE.GHRR01002158.1~~GHRR01002158.1.p1  ORF type:complete len:188 (+),score=16.33 GHRR01002158.1:177-740(+)